MASSPQYHQSFLTTLTRRRFLIQTVRYGLAAGGAAAGIFGPWHSICDASSPDISSNRSGPDDHGYPARYWVSTRTPEVDCRICHGNDPVGPPGYRHPEIIVKCLLCAQECTLKEGQRGQCRARVNRNGSLRSLVYGHPVSVHIDPIEKKPFYHFFPGHQAFSLATAGCPLRCRFCQNWQISQASPEDFNTTYVAPETVTAAAVKKNVPIVAFTYNEPTVFAEYLLDIARGGRPENLKSVLISCGFMNPEPLADMCQVLDAIKIDLKGFSKAFYRDVCGAELDPVLRSIRQVARSGVHLEIVNLMVPTLNDAPEMISEMVSWILGEIGPDVPVHFTKFHPDYQMQHLPPTPISSLEKAYEIARTKGLRYPYIGNYPGHPGNHTYCPGCGEVVIRRTGFFITENRIDKGRCRDCNTPIAGVWE